MRAFVLTVLSALSIAVSSFSTQAVTLTFDGLVGESLAPYVEGGFQQTCSAGCPTNAAFYSHRPGSLYSADPSGVSSTLGTNWYFMTTRLEAVDHSAFDLLSIDFADFNLQPYSQLMTLTWGFQDGSTGSMRFMTPAVAGLWTLTLNLGAVTYATWGVNEWIQWDNIRVDSPSIAPIPASLPLFLTAAACLGVAGWRKRKARAQK